MDEVNHTYLYLLLGLVGLVAAWRHNKIDRGWQNGRCIDVVKCASL